MAGAGINFLEFWVKFLSWMGQESIWIFGVEFGVWIFGVEFGVWLSFLSWEKIGESV